MRYQMDPEDARGHPMALVQSDPDQSNLLIRAKNSTRMMDTRVELHTYQKKKKKKQHLQPLRVSCVHKARAFLLKSCKQSRCTKAAKETAKIGPWLLMATIVIHLAQCSLLPVAGGRFGLRPLELGQTTESSTASSFEHPLASEPSVEGDDSSDYMLADSMTNSPETATERSNIEQTTDGKIGLPGERVSWSWHLTSRPSSVASATTASSASGASFAPVEDAPDLYATEPATSTTPADLSTLEQPSTNTLAGSSRVQSQSIDGQQLVRNRKSPENHQAAPGNQSSSPAAMPTRGSAFESLKLGPDLMDYDDFDLDYQLKLNGSASAVESGSSSRPASWSALVRQQPHQTEAPIIMAISNEISNEHNDKPSSSTSSIDSASTTRVPALAESQASSSSSSSSSNTSLATPLISTIQVVAIPASNQSSPSVLTSHSRVPTSLMMPSLLTVKSTQLSSQELEQVRPQFMLYQDNFDSGTASYGADQSNSFANGDLLATASGGGGAGSPLSLASMLLLTNSSSIGPQAAALLLNNTAFLHESSRGSQTGIASGIVLPAKPDMRAANSSSNPVAPLAAIQGQAEATGVNTSNPSSGEAREATSKPKSENSTGRSNSNQWFNYPHPSLHHNPLLLHHILNKPSLYAQHVGANQVAQPVSTSTQPPALPPISPNASVGSGQQVAVAEQQVPQQAPQQPASSQPGLQPLAETNRQAMGQILSSPGQMLRQPDDQQLAQLLASRAGRHWIQQSISSKQQQQQQQQQQQRLQQQLQQHQQHRLSPHPGPVLGQPATTRAPQLMMARLQPLIAASSSLAVPRLPVPMAMQSRPLWAGSSRRTLGSLVAAPSLMQMFSTGPYQFGPHLMGPNLAAPTLTPEHEALVRRLRVGPQQMQTLQPAQTSTRTSGPSQAAGTTNQSATLAQPPTAKLASVSDEDMSNYVAQLASFGSQPSAATEATGSRANLGQVGEQLENLARIMQSNSSLGLLDLEALVRRLLIEASNGASTNMSHTVDQVSRNLGAVAAPSQLVASRHNSVSWHRQPSLQNQLVVPQLMQPPVESTEVAASKAEFHNQQQIHQPRTQYQPNNFGQSQQKQLAFIEALKSSIASSKSAPNRNSSSSNPQLLDEILSLASADTNVTSSGPASSQSMAAAAAEAYARQVLGDHFDEQVANKPIPDWLEQQIVQRGFLNGAGRVMAAGNAPGTTVTTTVIGRQRVPNQSVVGPLSLSGLRQMPLSALTGSGFQFLRPTGNQQLNSMGLLGSRPIIHVSTGNAAQVGQPMGQFQGPAQVQSVRFALHPAAALQAILGQHRVHLGRQPSSGLQIQLHPAISPSGQLMEPQLPSQGPIQLTNQGQVQLTSQGPVQLTRLVPERMPLSAAPAYLIKLPTLTGGTITAAGSFAPPTVRLLRPRPNIPLRLLSAPGRFRLVASTSASQPISSTATLQTSPSAPKLVTGANLLHQSLFDHQTTGGLFGDQSALQRPLAAAPLTSTELQAGQAGGLVNLAGLVEPMESVSQPVAGPAELATQQAHLQLNPSLVNLTGLPGGSPASQLSQHRLPTELANSANPTLSRLQQATASLVELTSLASLVDEMAGGSDLDSSPALALAQAINSLQHSSQASSMQNEDRQTINKPNQNQHMQMVGPSLSLRSILNSSLWRDKQLSKARELGAIERLVSAANAVSSSKSKPQARLRVKYIRVPVAVYESGSSVGSPDLADVPDTESKGHFGSELTNNNAVGASNSLPNSASSTGKTSQDSSAALGQSNSVVSSSVNPDGLFDEALSSDSVPQLALALHDLASNESPVEPSSVDLSTNQLNHQSKSSHSNAYLSQLDQAGSKRNRGRPDKALDLYYASLLAAATNSPVIINPELNGSKNSISYQHSRTRNQEQFRRRPNKRGKKLEEDEMELEASDEQPDEDRVTKDDLPILESLISSVFHGAPTQQQANPFGGAAVFMTPTLGLFGQPDLAASQLASGWPLSRGLRVEASSPVAGFVLPQRPATSFGRHRISLGEVVGALGAKRLISSLLSRTRRARTSKRTVTRSPLSLSTYPTVRFNCNSRRGCAPGRTEAPLPYAAMVSLDNNTSQRSTSRPYKQAAITRPLQTNRLANLRTVSPVASKQHQAQNVHNASVIQSGAIISAKPDSDIKASVNGGHLIPDATKAVISKNEHRPISNTTAAAQQLQPLQKSRTEKPVEQMTTPKVDMSTLATFEMYRKENEQVVTLKPN